ncbi:MAG TPA: bifunctional phosphoglucose/phosphomannose isomerase [Fimbriimonadaceae bacterium]|nr:bifunctional phosphoglucose/phosphomannose isomerase [Fimbriimonadaceae bacterium]
MHPLDDRSFVERNDPAGMLRLTEAFPAQCRQAVSLAQVGDLPSLATTPGLVALTGLGGSAAGGDLTRALFEEAGSVPFLVNRDYSMPSYCGPGSLVFAVSYSGNTEETLAATADAKSKGATVVAVTSGGKLALEKTAGLITVPGGQPPRTALGYLFLPVVVACERLGLLPEQDYETAISLLDECVSLYGAQRPFDDNPAKQIAASLHGAFGVVYGLGSWQAIVANRWKGQINENAKNLALVGGYPELCHNEILGWVKAGGQGVSRFSGVFLLDGSESARMKKRAEVSARLVSDQVQFTDVTARGTSLLARLLTLTFIGDFVSIYLAALNDVDPENIDSINVLKSELAKLG